MKEQLAQSLFDHIPVGVGSQGIIPTSAKDLEAALEMGMDWSLREVGRSKPVVMIVRRSGCCPGDRLWLRAHVSLPQIKSPCVAWSCSELACSQKRVVYSTGAGCVGIVGLYTSRATGRVGRSLTASPAAKRVDDHCLADGP